MNWYRNNAPAAEWRQTRTGPIGPRGGRGGWGCAGGAGCAAPRRAEALQSQQMRRKWRALAVIVAATSALYAAGTAAMAFTPPPWGWVWLVPMAFAAALLLRLVQYPAERRAGRRDTGRCERCAYDLRATPQRCPECGRVPG